MELNDVEGVDGVLKVWVRRVWTLEMVSYITLHALFQGIEDKTNRSDYRV